MNITLSKCFLPLLMLTCLKTSADTISHRRIFLDSANHAIQQKMEHLESTVSKLDRLMDSISGKQVQKIDTAALYQFMMEKRKEEQREKEKLYIQIGGLLIIVVLVLAGWGKWKKSRKAGREAG